MKREFHPPVERLVTGRSAHDFSVTPKRGGVSTRRTCHNLFHTTTYGIETQGQSLVETALVFPILLMLLVGAVELARVERAAVAVSNAAKAGAQYAVQNGFTAQDLSGISNAAAAEAGGLNITTTSSYSCQCSDGSASTCQQTDCGNSHIEQTVTVKTSTSFDPVLHLPGLPSTWTIRGQAVQRCLQ